MARVKISRLVLGHLPFVGESYKGPLKNREYIGRFSKIENTIRILMKAVDDHGITIFAAMPATEGQLAALHLEALRETARRTNSRIALVPWIPVQLTIDGKAIEYYRRWLNYYEYERKLVNGILERYLDDPILQCREGWKRDLLHASSHSTPYSAREIERLSIDYKAVKSRIDSLKGFDVLFIELGTETDFLIISKRLDLLDELVKWVRETCGHDVILGTHHAGVTIPVLEKSGIKFQGYVTPINELGLMMFPTQQLAADAIRNAGKPIIAIKPLGGGRIPPNQAFRYVYNEIGSDSCMIGVSSEEEMDIDLKTAKDVLASG